MNKKAMSAVLREIKEVAMAASMTGAFGKGGRSLVNVYNKLLGSVAGDADVESLFPRLPDDASMDEVGVAAALLSRYLGVDEEKSRHGDDE